MTEAKQSFLIILWPIQTLAHANTDFHNVLSWCLYETKTPWGNNYADRCIICLITNYNIYFGDP